MPYFVAGNGIGVQRRIRKHRSPQIQMQVRQQPHVQPLSDLPDSDANTQQLRRSRLTQDINAILEEEKRLDKLFAECGQKITLDSFAIAEPFPVDESGKLLFRDLATKGRLSRALDDFFVYDAMHNHGRAQTNYVATSDHNSVPIHEGMVVERHDVGHHSSYALQSSQRPGMA